MRLVADPETGEYKFEVTPPEAAKPPEGQADLEQAGAISGLAKFQVFGLPLGAVGIAATTSILVDRLIGDRIAGWGTMGNLVVAWAVKQFGTRFIGAPAADATAFILVYEAVADTVQQWVNQAWPGGQAQPKQTGGGGMQQQPATSSGYYNYAFRRG